MTPDDLLKRLGVLTQGHKAALLIAMRAAVAFAVNYAVLHQLSGQKLNRRTGNLQRDVEKSPNEKPPRIEGDLIIGTIGTSLGYGKAHEQGFHGTVPVKAHTRRRLGAVRAIEIRTRRVTKRARVRKSIAAKGPIAVRSHLMRMNVRARWYLRDSARASKGQLNSGASRALEHLARTGRLPRVSDLLGVASA